MAYPATPKTWVAGDVLTAAQLNAELRDALLGAFPLGPPDVAWTSFTPTLTQSATVTKTVTYAKYQRIGRLVFFSVDLSVTGAGTAGNEILIGLPVTAAATALLIGSGLVFDSSASLLYNGNAQIGTTTTAKIWAGGASSAPGNLGATGFTAALASGDLVRVSGFYEAAS